MNNTKGMGPKLFERIMAILCLGFGIGMETISQWGPWMDLVSIYITVPIGATLGAVSWFYVMKKDELLSAINTGSGKTRGRLWYGIGRYLYVPLAVILCCVLIKGKIPGRPICIFPFRTSGFCHHERSCHCGGIWPQPGGDWNLHIFFFYLCFYRSSLLLAGAIFLKAMAGISALYMLSLSTPVNQLVPVLQKLHLPSLLVELMNLIYRYILS